MAAKWLVMLMTIMAAVVGRQGVIAQCIMAILLVALARVAAHGIPQIVQVLTNGLVVVIAAVLGQIQVVIVAALLRWIVAHIAAAGLTMTIVIIILMVEGMVQIAVV